MWNGFHQTFGIRHKIKQLAIGQNKYREDGQRRQGNAVIAYTRCLRNMNFHLQPGEIRSQLRLVFSSLLTRARAHTKTAEWKKPHHNSISYLRCEQHISYFRPTRVQGGVFVYARAHARSKFFRFGRVEYSKFSNLAGNELIKVERQVTISGVTASTRIIGIFSAIRVAFFVAGGIQNESTFLRCPLGRRYERNASKLLAECNPKVNRPDGKQRWIDGSTRAHNSKSLVSRCLPCSRWTSGQSRERNHLWLGHFSEAPSFCLHISARTTWFLPPPPPPLECLACVSHHHAT